MSEQTGEWTNQIHQGDAAETLAEMPADSVDCVVTSPPYWGLRDYQIEGQIGVEQAAKEYIAQLVEIGDEMARVLKPTGSVWMNLGDTYNGASIIRPDSMDAHARKGEDGYEGQLAENREESGIKRRSSSQYGIARQSRLFIPERFAAKMCESGWRCRDHIIWAKEHPKPEGRVSSRLTQSHEPIFRFVLTEDAKFYRRRDENPVNVWQMKTASVDHPAPFPPELPRRAIELTTDEGDTVLDPFVGSGTTCMVAKNMGRDYLGVDLNPQFVAQSQARLGMNIDRPELLDGKHTPLTAFTDGGQTQQRE